MKILVIGGTRFFGVHLVNKLIEKGHEVTILTRGRTKDSFSDNVNRISADRSDPESVRKALQGRYYDVICDNIAYSSNDIRYVLDVVECGKYIYTSSGSVYADLHMDIGEDSFDPLKHMLIWCNRDDYPYDEIKRQGECALFQHYSHLKPVAVRFPFVIGTDDYTERFRFYIEHIINQKPMNCIAVDNRIGFISSDDAGRFIAFLAESEYSGTVNAASAGSLSVAELIRYTEKKTGKKAIFSENGDEAPYNCDTDFCLNTDIAKNIGFRFSNLNDWVYDLADYYIENL